jgi:hypothetical protein
VLSGNDDIAFIALESFVFEALQVFGARGEELTLSFGDTKEIEVVGDYACHCPKCGLENIDEILNASSIAFCISARYGDYGWCFAWEQIVQPALGTIDEVA